MYRAFFGLGEAPFRITPDPRFLHHDPVVEEALRAITTGIAERAGLLLLVGEVGTGKTTLVRELLDTLPASVRTVLVLHPTVAFDEILDHVLLELGLPVAGGGRDVLLERLAEFLREHAREGDVAVFFDEAQALRAETLIALPDLLDLVTEGGRPAMQIVLAGQPELDGRLAAQALARLRARVAVTARLRPLSRDGVGAYVRARLERAGARDRDLFTRDALERLATFSQGVPRVINVLCENALVAAFADGQQCITGRLVEAVWADYEPLHRPEGTPMPAPPTLVTLSGSPPGPEPATRRSTRRLALALGVAVLVLLPVLAVMRPWQSPPPVVPHEEAVPGRPEPAALDSPRPGAASGPAAVPTGATPPTAAAEDAAPPGRAAHADGSVEAEPAGDAATPRRETPPSAVEAVELVDRFWRAYQTRDPEGLRALFAPGAAPAGKILDVDPTGGGALVAPVAGFEAKPVGDRVTVRVPFVLNTRDDHGRTVRRQGVATWQIAMRDGAPRIVALAAESGPAPRR